MSREKKIKLFASAILQELSFNDIDICKSACTVLKSNNKQVLSTLFTSECESHSRHDESDEETSEINEECVECVVTAEKYKETDFYLHFHLRKETFNALLKEIENDPKLFEIGKYAMTTETCLLVTLWFLAQGVGLGDVAQKFNLEISKVKHVIEVILKVLVKKQSTFIKWPSETESAKISSEFFRFYGYPDVIGAIDSTHINIKPPIPNEDKYRNKKMGYSVILQAICNAQKEFINVFAGFPGALQNSTVLKHSTLYKEIEETTPAAFFYNKYHLVGNYTYPLRSWLMTRFGNSSIKREHIKHNSALQASLSVISNAFSLLRARWRSLHFINLNSVNTAKDIIEVCCVLHNFCLKFGDTFDEMLKNSDEELIFNTDYLDVTKEGESKRDRNLCKFR